MKTAVKNFLYFFLCIEIISKALLFSPWFCEKFFEISDSGNRIFWASRYFYHKSKSSFYYPFDEYDKTKGWRLKPNLTDFMYYFDKTVSTNSKNIRGKIEYSYEKPASVKKRILLIGDSYTFGDQVSDNETYPYFLQQMLGPGYEVINMGVHGYGHDQMLLKLKEEGVLYKPDIVVLGYCKVDNLRNLFSFRDFAKPKFILKDRKLLLTHVPVPTVNQLLWTEPFRLHSLDWLAIEKFYLDNKNGKIEKEKNEITTALLDEMRNVCRGIGAQFIIFNVTPQDEILSTKPSTESEDFIGKYANERGVPMANPRQFLRAHFSPFRYKMRYHYNVYLNHDVALIYAQFLKQYFLN